MIHDLDATLQILLEEQLPAALSRAVSVSFEAPGDQFPPQGVSLPAIDLFLYDVRENRNLRSNEPRTARRGDGTASISRAPYRIDCSYLVTAWPGEGMSRPAVDEHLLLGETMRVLLAHPTLPRGVLQGSLAQQALPLPTVSLQAGKLQSLGEFWQALGGRPKASLHYTVTIAAEVHPAVEAALVTRTGISIRQSSGAGP